MNVTMYGADDLFAWSDGRIVLLVERDGDAWVIARSWKQADRLTDVRRWRFADERRLAGQLRRLVRERVEHDAIAESAAASLTSWLPARVPA